jgi:hypothetical protein
VCRAWSIAPSLRASKWGNKSERVVGEVSLASVQSAFTMNSRHKKGDVFRIPIKLEFTYRGTIFHQLLG